MNCKQISAKLSAFVDGELDGTEMLMVRSHIQDCATCESELAVLRRVKHILSTMPSPDPASDFEARLCNVVFQPDQAVARVSAFASWKLVFASGLATAAAVLAVLQLFSPRESGELPLSPKDINGQIARDQAMYAGADPLSGGAPVILVNSR